VFLDAEFYFSSDLILAPVILDNLTSASKIPPPVAVFISILYTDGRRSRAYEYPDFAEFLAKELVPWVRTNYTVTKDPHQTVIGGISLGGLGAAYAALRHSDVFGNALCQSGSFWRSWRAGPYAEPSREPGALARAFLKSPKLPIRFYLDVGTFEADFSGSGGYNLEMTRLMRDVLRAKGYEVHYQEFAGGHEYLNWRGTLADGLIALLGKSEESK
jgi:enterochelin esterase family protein